MKSQRQRDTGAEIALRSLLHRHGLRFRVHYPLPQLRRRADVAFPTLHIAIFVDGCFWHGCPDHGTWPKQNAEWWREKIEANQQRDANTDSTLNEQGWTVVRVWEHEDSEAAALRIERLVRSLRPVSPDDTEADAPTSAASEAVDLAAAHPGLRASGSLLTPRDSEQSRP
jgi:DNA mismatch endonuclease (patch repair protein)